MYNICINSIVLFYMLYTDAVEMEIQLKADVEAQRVRREMRKVQYYILYINYYTIYYI